MAKADATLAQHVHKVPRVVVTELVVVLRWCRGGAGSEVVSLAVVGGDGKGVKGVG